MKKILRCILALTIALIMFTAPSIAQAAPIPNILESFDDSKLFQFSPAYNVNGGPSIHLKDITNSTGEFFVPAGKTFNFSVALASNSTFTILIRTRNQIISHGFHEGSFAILTTEPRLSDEYYTVTITPVNSLSINEYYFSYY